MKYQNLHNAVFDNSTRKKNPNITLRMAPMIDLIFLLLIFFLVAAKFRPAEAFLPMKLPAANAAQSLRIAAPSPMIIQISDTPSGCRIDVSDIHSVDINSQTAELDLALLMEKIKDCMTSQKRYADDPVQIKCAAQVKWDDLAKIYNLLTGMGLTDITFPMIEPTEKSLNE